MPPGAFRAAGSTSAPFAPAPPPAAAASSNPPSRTRAPPHEGHRGRAEMPGAVAGQVVPLGGAAGLKVGSKDRPLAARDGSTMLRPFSTPTPTSTSTSSRPRSPLAALPNHTAAAPSSASATLESKSSEVITSSHFGGATSRPSSTTKPKPKPAAAAVVVPSKRPSPTASRTRDTTKGRERASVHVKAEADDEVDQLASDNDDDDEAGALEPADENVPPSAQPPRPVHAEHEQAHGLEAHPAKKARTSLDSGYDEALVGGAAGPPPPPPRGGPGGPGDGAQDIEVEVPESEHGEEEGAMLLEDKEEVVVGRAAAQALPGAVVAGSSAGRVSRVGQGLSSSGQTTGSSTETDNDVDTVAHKLLSLTERRAVVMEEFVEIATSGTGVTAVGREEGEVRVSLSYLDERILEARAQLAALGAAPTDLQLATEQRATTLEELAEVVSTGLRSHAGNDEEFVRHML
ncbi:hypothetical protein JCM3775_003214, partial [Rhodotorula graminis]